MRYKSVKLCSSYRLTANSVKAAELIFQHVSRRVLVHYKDVETFCQIFEQKKFKYHNVSVLKFKKQKDY